MPKQIRDLTGQQYGYWTVIGPAPKRFNTIHWLCRCRCGTTRAVQSGAMRSGRSRGCGAHCKAQWLTFEEAREQARQLGFKTKLQWQLWSSTPDRPNCIPTKPFNTYRDQWQGWADFLGFSPRP